MQIHRVIQERRRALDMTQEQVADALGVTASAVNKWERAATCPDVALLAPLARLLRIDLNELMGFHESPSDGEVQTLAQEALQTAERDGLDAGLALARERMRDYPNSGSLAYMLAAVLQGFATFSSVEPEVQAQFDRWYELAADCDDAQVRERAATMLAGRAIARGDWDAAQRAIDAMPAHPGMDRRVLQANLCLRRGEADEAARLLQEKVLAAGSELCAALQMLVEAELAAGETDAAAKVAGIVEAAVEELDLWRYTGVAAPLQCAVAERDVQKSVQRLRALLDALAEIWRPGESPLYRRIAGEKEGAVNERVYAPLLHALERDPEYDFLRGNAGFEEILAELRRRAG